jgi:16S rRNA (cytosine967-C5)-methyltransferase
VVANGATWKPRHKVPYVLLDAPCSATGTASKRPDVLWKDETLLPALIVTQYDLLRHALDHFLLPGGILVYATCSLLKRESEDQVARLLHERPDDVELVPFTPDEIPGVAGPHISTEGYIRIIPTPLLDVTSAAELGGDGFFVARLRKRTSGVSP